MRASTSPFGRPTYGQTVTDRFGTAHSSTTAAAMVAFGDAVQGVAEHRPTSAAALERALAADPNLIAGHALKGFGGILLARHETVEAAATTLHQAHRACARKGSATPDELMLVHALQDAVQGRMCAAADRIDRHLAAAPENLLFVKLVQSLRFMAGDLAGMCGSIERVATAWSPATPGYGFMLGCRAFTLEEKGDFAGAERVGRAALAHAPTDAWGLHAVAHVFEMTGRTADGIAWLEETRENWAGCNNFFFHLAWHLALFQLECGLYQRVLDLYDEAVRPRSTDDFRDVANAASLLWRLRQEGVEVGNRWRELAEIARRRRHEAELVFATLHYLLALVATGDLAAARELVASLQTRADTGTGDQAVVAAAVGLPVARAILDLAQGGAKGDVPDLAMLARRLPRVGGSHAQRDVFVRTLTELAARRGDLTTVRAILSLRRRLKREDRFVEAFGPQRTAPVPAWHPRHATPAPPRRPPPTSSIEDPVQ